MSFNLRREEIEGLDTRMTAKFKGSVNSLGWKFELSITHCSPTQEIIITGSCVLKKYRYGWFNIGNSGLFSAADVESVIIVRMSEKESESYNIS